jgi:diguanylate cyclase (GGDEF)-like protein
MQSTSRKIWSQSYAQVAFGVLLSALIILLYLIDVTTRYRSAIADAKTTALNFADILAEHTALTFDTVERTLREAIKIREESNRLGGAEANAALRLLRKSSPVIVAVGWTDAFGNVVAHSYNGPPARPNIADMPHFIEQRDHAGDNNLSIAPPYRSAVQKKWFTAASLRLTSADGSFAGVVSAPIDQSYFLEIYRSLNLGQSGGISLLHRSGRLLAREPEGPEAIGKSFANGPLLTELLPKSPAGAYETVSVIDGISRIAAYKTVRSLPLLVVVTYARDEVLSGWHHYLWMSVPLVTLTVGAIFVGTLLLARRSRALISKSEGLEIASRNLADVNRLFEIALSSMPNGLCMFDAEKRIAISNARYRDMYGLTEDNVRPGTPLRNILETHLRNGETSELGIDGFIDACLNLPTQTQLLQDGRTVFIRRNKIPEGGWIATHEDISELKRHQEMLEQMNGRFDAAINNMSQGVCLYDAGQKIVVSNRRYAEIYHLSPAQIKPGTSLREVLEYRRQQGTHFNNLSPDDYVGLNIRQSSEIRELTDGRIVSISRHQMSDGGWLTTHEDITDRARSEQKIAHLARHDMLTGLPNRAFFTQMLDGPVNGRDNVVTNAFAVFMLDLDKFKQVNDTLGHAAGDQLLVEVARRIKAIIRETDILARLGGDEFAIVQPLESAEAEQAISLALRIVDTIALPFDLDGHRVNIGTSIGIALAPQDGHDPGDLVKKADVALYAAKAEGRNDFRLFKPHMVQAADQQKALENDLRQAIANREFELHYQTIIDVRTQKICGAEALVRWHHPQRGVLDPDQFISVAEASGLIVPLGDWILQQACSDASSWPACIKLAVNLSAVQFNKGNLFEVVLCALVESGLNAERLELEITESALLDRQAAHLQTIRQLKNLGVTVALDDFGTGYSSASYVTKFPFDRIKIERSFTQGAIERRDCAAVIASVLALARELDMSVTAEGVETERQFQMLRNAGIECAQGYLFGRPAPQKLFMEENFPLSDKPAAPRKAAS